MTKYEMLKNMSVDEIVEWIDKYATFDDALYWQWWDENYCNNCEPEIVYVPELDKTHECAWCELNGKCKFFKEMNEIPDSKQIIKMWLLSEC